MKQNTFLSSRLIYNEKAGKVSVRTSVKGSITVEAAMAVPIFFFAVISLLYLMEIMSIQTAVRSGLQYAGKMTARDACVTRAAVPSKVEAYVVNAIGASRLGRSMVEGGSGGIDCSGSYLSPGTGIGELRAEYRIRIPLPFFRIPLITYRERMRVKAWIGYVKGGIGAERSQIVYVTETGLVYHRDYHCTHLELTPRMVSMEAVEGLRNDSGGRYYPCEHCRKSGQGVYITNTGNRYHGSLSCSGLKRTVYAVPLSEVVGKGACSRCGQ